MFDDTSKFDKLSLEKGRAGRASRRRLSYRDLTKSSPTTVSNANIDSLSNILPEAWHSKYLLKLNGCLRLGEIVVKSHIKLVGTREHALRYHAYRRF